MNTLEGLSEPHLAANLPAEAAPQTESGLGRLATRAVSKLSEFMRGPSRRNVALLAAAVLGATATLDTIDVTPANAQLAKIGHNDVPCPDPSVIQEPWNHNNLIAECTSDYGQRNFLFGGGFGMTPNALPILESDDAGLHWRLRNYVFTKGNHPTAAEAPQGNWPGPRYWAPAEYYNPTNGLSETYFATGINAGTAVWIKKHYGVKAEEGEMAIFVAWSKDPFASNWHSKLLRFRGQYNNVTGNAQETMGGLIDPSVSPFSKTGQLILGYTVQPNQTFIEQLTPDGLHVSKQVRRISYANLPWEAGTEEGGVLHEDKGPGYDVMEEELNTGSTWGNDGHDYKTKFIASADPLHGRWVEDDKPILTDGDGLFDPGLGSQPLTMPNGNTYIFYHVLPSRRDHQSQDRLLYRSTYRENSPNKLYVPDGESVPGSVSHNKRIFYFDKGSGQYVPVGRRVSKIQASGAGSSSDVLKPQKQYVQISVPVIGNGGRP